MQNTLGNSSVFLVKKTLCPLCKLLCVLCGKALIFFYHKGHKEKGTEGTKRFS